MMVRKISNRRRVRIPLRDALVMIGGYVRRSFLEQLRSVAFIIVYLFVFQTLILRSPLENAFALAGGIALVVVGLTFFLEGVLRGLMPLGERVGITLPSRCGITIIVLFGILVGIGATFAEPSIAVLRTAGARVTAWEAPLLYVLLERYTEFLVIAIALGVGAAVAVGVTRFYYGFSIKLLIFTVIPLLLASTIACHFEPNLASIIGLAWDSGAVTTGPVTVPLVLAFGIGVSRATGKGSGSSSGFGVIMLASAFPVLAVLVLGAIVNRAIPAPTAETTFFSACYRDRALSLFASEEDLLRHAFLRGSGAGRQAFFQDEQEYQAAITSVYTDPVFRYRILGDLDPITWLHERASEEEKQLVAPHVRISRARPIPQENIGEVLRKESGLATRAVVPLTVLLLFVLIVLLRERPQYYDEVVFGIIIALFGMLLLTSGIRLGLAPLGNSVGSQLPRAFRMVDEDYDRIIVEDFDLDLLFESVDTEGNRHRFFYLHGPSGPRPVEYDPQQYDPDRQRYEHILRRSPLFGPDLTLLGLGLVFLFAFGMGYGSTLAEPALNALGRTVEDLTVETVRRTEVVRAVSIGVGLGLVTGVARILYDFPIVYLLVPFYALLMVLTIWSEEDFAGIAWDCGGVTTGPVTVPLVLAMGLAIGREMNVIDGFGILAMASVLPNIVVLLYGFIVRARQHRTIRDLGAGNGDG